MVLLLEYSPSALAWSSSEGWDPIAQEEFVPREHGERLGDDLGIQSNCLDLESVRTVMRVRPTVKAGLKDALQQQQHEENDSRGIERHEGVLRGVFGVRSPSHRRGEYVRQA